MADCARGGKGAAFIGQSLRLCIDYTVSVDASSKTQRGAAVLAALAATMALHALVIGWAIFADSTTRPPPPPKPIRIELVTESSVRTPEEPPSDAVGPSPAQPPSPTSQPVSRSPATEPLPTPAPDAHRGGMRVLQSIDPDADKIANPEPQEPRNNTAALDDDFAVSDSDQPTAAAAPNGQEVESPREAAPPTLSEPASAAAPTNALPAEQGGEQKPISAEGRWRYRVFYGDYPANNQVATLDYVLRIDGGRYRLHTEGQAVGLLALFYRGAFTQVSEGAFSGAGFAPERYEERRGDRPPRVVTIAPSDNERRIARFEDGRTEDASGIAQDRLSMAAQFAWLGAARSGLLRQPTLDVGLIGVSSVRKLRFELTRDQMLQLPGGIRQLVRLRSEDGDGGSSGSVEVWVSESGELMPYRIRLEDRNGQVLDQVLSTD